MKTKQLLYKLPALTVLGALMMGNQKCEQKPPPARVLKKIVQMGTIASSPLLVPEGSFDFQFVANQQIYGVLSDNDHFALKYNAPIAFSPKYYSSSSEVSPFNFSSKDDQALQSFSKMAHKGDFNVEYSQTAWCMVNLPQAKISGAVNSFEMLGGGGLTIGFGAAGAHPVSGLTSANFNLQFAQMDLSLAAYRPLTNNLLAASNVTSKQTKTQIGLGLNLGGFALGPSFYYQTPLAKVTKNALTMAVNNLDAKLKKEEWFTRVLANHDTHLVVIGGTDINLEPGDQLLVYNEDYYWEGEPCNSKYLGGGSSLSNAVAKIEIDWVGDEISRGKIIEQNDYNAVVGAKVRLFKLRPDDYKAPAPGVLAAK